MGMAFAIWNAGGSPKLIPMVLPDFGRLQMLIYPNLDEIEMYLYDYETA